MFCFQDTWSYIGRNSNRLKCGPQWGIIKWEIPGRNAESPFMWIAHDANKQSWHAVLDSWNLHDDKQLMVQKEATQCWNERVNNSASGFALK